MDTSTINLIERYIENNYFWKLIGMDFKIISEGVVDYLFTIKKNI